MKKRLIKRGAFGFAERPTSVERRSILTHLSQGTAAGALGGFVMLWVLILSTPNVYNFFYLILLPFFLFYGAVNGFVAGSLIWLSKRLLGRNSMILRIGIGTLFSVILSIGWSLILIEEPKIQRPSIYRFASLAACGLSIGLLTGSNIRPWRLIARGATAPPRLKVLFSRGPIRISRTIEEVRFSFLTGLPLRVASLVALMVSLLLVACTLSLWLSHDEWSGNPKFLIECLIATAYLAATICVSFTMRGKLLVLTMALLLNVPLAVWMYSFTGVDPDTNSLINIAYFFIGFWLLFVLGVIAFPKNKGVSQVEYGHTEIRFGKQQWVKESL